MIVYANLSSGKRNHLILVRSNKGHENVPDGLLYKTYT